MSLIDKGQKNVISSSRNLPKCPSTFETFESILNQEAKSIHNKKRAKTFDPPENPGSVQVLDFNGNSKCLRNRIKIISGLDHFVNLKELNLSNNNITKIQNLAKLTNLKKLDISFNKICKIENISALKHLEVLNLSSNCIQEIPVIIVKNANLCELYLACNIILKSESISHLKSLEKLQILDLSYNPICKTPEYPFIVTNMLIKLCYLDGNALSKRLSLNKSLKTENNPLQSSLSVLSSYSHRFQNPVMNGNILEEATSCRDRPAQMNLRNGRPHSMGGELPMQAQAQSQRSTVTGAHRMSSIGSVGPIEENILYENSLLKESCELRLGNLRRISDANRKDTLNVQENNLGFDINKENYNNNVQKGEQKNNYNHFQKIHMSMLNKQSGFEIETPELDELLQTSLMKNYTRGSLKRGNNGSYTQSQEYPDPFYKAVGDVKEFANKVRMDKSLKSSFVSKFQEGGLESASVSQVGTPKNGYKKDLSNKQKENEKETEKDQVNMIIAQLQELVQKRISKWQELTSEIESKRTTVLDISDHLNNNLQTSISDLDNFRLPEEEKIKFLEEVCDLAEKIKYYFKLLEQHENDQNAFLHSLQGGGINQTDLDDLFGAHGSKKIKAVINKILDLETSFKKNNYRGYKPQRGILTEVNLFAPHIDDILSKFHEVTELDEKREQIFIETTDLHEKIEKIKVEIKTLVPIDRSQQLENYYLQQALLSSSNVDKSEKTNAKKRETLDLDDKENINTLNHQNTLGNVQRNFSSSPKQKENLKKFLKEEHQNLLLEEKLNQYGNYEITYEKSILVDRKDFDHNVLSSSLVSSHQKEIRDSYSIDYARAISGNQAIIDLHQPDLLKSLELVHSQNNEAKKRKGSCQNDLIIRETNSSQIIDPAYLESGGSSLQNLSAKKGRAFTSNIYNIIKGLEANKIQKSQNPLVEKYKREIFTLKEQINQLNKEKEQNKQTISSLKEICEINFNKIDEIKSKFNSTLDISSNPYNPFKWVLETQSSAIEGLVQHNKELQEKIIGFLASYNRFQTMESLGSITESESNFQDSHTKQSSDNKQIDNENKEYENLLSPEQQQQESPQENGPKTENISPNPKIDFGEFETQEKSLSDGELKKRRIYLSRSEIKEKLSPEVQTRATSLAIKHKEFTFKKEESDNKIPKPLNFNTQEFSVKNKLSFEKGDGLSRSISSNQASERKIGRDFNFQNISLQARSKKQTKITDNKERILDNSDIEINNNINEQIENQHILNPNCSICLSDENKYEEEHDFYPEEELPGNRLQTEPIPGSDNSRGFYYTNMNMSCYSPINSDMNDNGYQYFSDKLRNYDKKRSKVSQYPTLKEKIVERTGKVPKSTSSLLLINKTNKLKSQKITKDSQRPFTTSNLWENRQLSPESNRADLIENISPTSNNLTSLTSRLQKTSIDYSKIFRKPSNYNKALEADNTQTAKIEAAQKLTFENLSSPSISSLIQKPQHLNNKPTTLYFNNFRSTGALKAKSFVNVTDDI